LGEWDWKSYTAAILGSGLVVFMVTTLYSDLINKPRVNIETPNHHQIEITNTGLAPATHLILTIKSIGNIAHIFSTESITQNSSTQINVSRLASGKGSNITINLSKPDTRAPTVYATYDQGSIRHPPIPNLYENYLVNLPIIIPSIGAVISLIFLVEQRSKNRILRFISAKIYLDLRLVLKIFKHSPLNVQKWIEQGSVYSNTLWEDRKFEANKTKFFDKDDLSLIYKFFSSLIERDSEINEILKSGSIAPSSISNANCKLDKAAECAYKHIYWEKYTGFEFMKYYTLWGKDLADKVKFVTFILTKKDRKYALIQLILIDSIITIVFYPTSFSYPSFVYYVYSLTILFSFVLWTAIVDHEREKKRKEIEKLEIAKRSAQSDNEKG